MHGKALSLVHQQIGSFYAILAKLTSVPLVYLETPKRYLRVRRERSRHLRGRLRNQSDPTVDGLAHCGIDRYFRSSWTAPNAPATHFDVKVGTSADSPSIWRLRMNTEETLVERYGVLLTLKQLAQLFDRSPDGLRVTLRGNAEVAQQLRSARVKIGRRVHFKTKAVAEILDSL